MIKVLIVEDHASMRESLTTALVAAGDFSVVGEVPNADYALDFCKHLHPDLVLMDEPFQGLDTETRRMALAAVKKWTQGRPLLLISHEPADGPALGAKTLTIQELSDKGCDLDEST